MPMGPGTYGSKKGRPMKVKGKRKKLDVNKDGKLTGKRNKLDMDKDGKLTKKDFAMLRNKKKARA